MTNEEMATHFGVSLKTIQNHVSNVLGKLHVVDRTQAAIRGREAGLGRRWGRLKGPFLAPSPRRGVTGSDARVARRSLQRPARPLLSPAAPRANPAARQPSPPRSPPAWPPRSPCGVPRRTAPGAGGRGTAAHSGLGAGSTGTG